MRDDGDEREDDTDVSVETGQTQRGQGGAPEPKAVSSDGSDRVPVVPWGGGVQEVKIQAPEEVEGGGKTNIPTEASWPVIEVDSDGGVMRRPVLGDRSRVAYRGCSVLVGYTCSCRNHDGELAEIQDSATNAVTHAQITPRITGSWSKLL